MRYLPFVLLLAASAAPSFAPSLAWAETIYSLDKVTVIGNAQVPTSTLSAVVKEKAGDKVTKDQILADQDAIYDAYKKANVGMAITVLLATKGAGHAEVTFKIDEKAAPPPSNVVVPNKVAHMTFVGNKVETTDVLAAAAGLKVGDVVTNESLIAARDRIGDVYKNDKKAHVSLNLQPQINTPTPGQVDIVWQITETAAKKKPRNTDDPGGQAMDQ